jgi:two-component system sensor histidine kinase BaeS
MARRLLLSYIVIIGLTVALMGLIINRVTAQTFSLYLSNQAAAHSEMLPVMLTGYYARNGSWAGVQADIEEAGLMIGAPLSLADERGRIIATTQAELMGQAAATLSNINVTIPVLDGSNTAIGTVYVQRNLSHQRADETFLANVTRALMITGLVVALLAAGLGVLLTRSISRPLADMEQAALRFARGDYTARVSPRGQDEVATLGRTFNQMAESVGSVERLRRELVANVSHDLRTPLTVIRGYLEGLRSGEIADRRSAEMAFEAMHAEVARLLHLVGDLRQTAALDSGALLLNRRPITARALASEAIDRITPLAATKGIHLRSQVPAELPPLNIDVERLGQALFNLLENAVRHTPAGGKIEITAQRQAEQVQFIVRDTGDGIAAADLPHIFERFYRADRARNPVEGRAGLGLSIVKSIVEAHGGVIKAESEGTPGKGSVFTISLPLPTFPE